MLTGVGTIFVYSASEYWSEVHYANNISFGVKQAIYAVVAIGCSYIVMKLTIVRKPSFWRVAYFGSMLLLLALYIPGIGVVRNGSRSWIELGFFSIQPAEFMKISAVIYFAYCSQTLSQSFSIDHLKKLLIFFIPIGIIMVQPDFGSACILFAASMFVLFVSNYSIKFFIAIFGTAFAGVIFLIISAPYRLKRIEAYIDPWQDPLGSGFQAIQSLLAIGPAGLFGHGFGQSRQKFLYLPEPQNDFIFAIITEEMGFIGGMVLVLLLIGFLISGFAIAGRMLNRAHFISTIGLLSMIGCQIVLNIGVVIGLFPVTGVTLPFISYGGSSLLSTWLIVGIILAFAHQDWKKGENEWKKSST